jgi:AraC-like DNA-binding protein
MSDQGSLGVLYTEHTDLLAETPLASLWSYNAHVREPDRPLVRQNQHRAHEFWLDWSDPLLNTILPGTQVSLVLNFGDAWAAGRSLVTTSLIPHASIVGPVTQPRILRLGRTVRAIGVVVSPLLARAILDVPASQLVDQIIPLDDVWPRRFVNAWCDRLARLEPRESVLALRDAIVQRVRAQPTTLSASTTAATLIQLRGGNLSIESLARTSGLSHRQFARRFVADTGLAPKLFSRITRFNGLVRTLLSTDMSRWASASLTAGFYDQAHMINEFRFFAGAAPRTFFRPHDDTDPNVSGR